jgi:hypothetical protein
MTINNICKRKKNIKCPEKKEPTSPIHAAENLYMDFAGACRMPTAEKFWQAAELKDVIN